VAVQLDERAKVFRKKAVDRLSSPDELTTMLTVGRSYAGWLLAAVGGVLLAALVWGITGTIALTADGAGEVLAERGGRAVLYIPGEAAVHVRPGQPVRLRPADPAQRELGARTGRVAGIGSERPVHSWPPLIPVNVEMGGGEPPLPARTALTGEVVLGSRRPITLLLPNRGR
jgi:hypothetical protein